MWVIVSPARGLRFELIRSLETRVVSYATAFLSAVLNGVPLDSAVGQHPMQDDSKLAGESNLRLPHSGRSGSSPAFCTRGGAQVSQGRDH